MRTSTERSEVDLARPVFERMRRQTNRPQNIAMIRSSFAEPDATTYVESVFKSLQEFLRLEAAGGR